MRAGVREVAACTVVAALFVSACGGKKKPAAAPRETPQPRVPTEEEIFANTTVEQLNAQKPLGDAYFDLDSQTIRDDAKPVLQKDADWLKRWGTIKVMIEGHGDSRGSAEYNLALGERRASAVRDYLVNLGVGTDRIQLVSKGKEAPVCTEEAESCWQQNRRGHFVITAK